MGHAHDERERERKNKGEEERGRGRERERAREREGESCVQHLRYAFIGNSKRLNNVWEVGTSS